jgi:hypothetical protein
VRSGRISCRGPGFSPRIRMMERSSPGTQDSTYWGLSEPEMRDRRWVAFTPSMPLSAACG